ncbi:aspartate aminotransferase [Bifidobacterium lemurum]|uniref:cysteine-S-conjugate beta-lyase n=1 Tax=Bifidobacterium lemurum TaxID=1603886 RepID=A0A261FRP1_9BIFI|nr:aminotransferase class I/II-fold pyridoxal phosphate-dependent enzyme [Bifidobacterium lemurum]OZG61799.1 aspartate aminotransferase [Bifidobacterium lemurum]QOL34948.1 aminotransferase class I/II-fold pyridoxal phosphate-dependent enzyme [Bifidobacterium lemurum]
METQTLTATGFSADVIDHETAADLAQIGSDKWTRYPGCIGAFIAEMDYGLAPVIQEAIEEAADDCKLGYIPDPWKHRVAEACAAWQKNHYGWDVDPAYIRPVPDVLEAYEIFLREFVGAGNSVIVPTPAYMPFLSVPRLYNVDLIEIPMIEHSDGWLFDFDAIEEAFRNGCHAFVLCNPHNPIGKVLTLEEELKISELAAKYGVRVFSDEIHAPFVFDGYRHVPFASINETTVMQAITSTSASKSFNIPGTKCAQVILTNPDDLKLWMDRAEWSEHQTATIGAIATTAAYTKGEPWFQEALKYVKHNFDLLDSEMHGRFSKVGYVRPQGTYIAWLDFKPLGINDPSQYFLEKAKVALTDGKECGKVGAGCVRMNFAMPYPLLQECFDRMYRALHDDGLL